MSGTWDISGFDLSELRRHVREMHPNIPHPARRNTDLAAQHARRHTRYHSGHNHMAGRITIRISGLPVEYDEGWITGQGALTPEEALARFLRRNPG
jgi:hypothetical protein